MNVRWCVELTASDPKCGIFLVYLVITEYSKVCITYSEDYYRLCGLAHVINRELEFKIENTNPPIIWLELQFTQRPMGTYITATDGSPK